MTPTPTPVATKITAAAAVAVLTLGLTGCGLTGGGSPTAGRAPAKSKVNASKPAPIAIKSIRGKSAPDALQTVARPTSPDGKPGAIVARVPTKVTGEFVAEGNADAASDAAGKDADDKDNGYQPKYLGKTAEVNATADAGVPSHAELQAVANANDAVFGANPAPRSINAFGEFDGKANPAGDVLGATGFAQLTFVDEGYDSDVSVSSDGSHMIFASTRHSDRTDIYRQKIGSQSVTQLTADPADDAFPSYSRDGRKVAFASNRAGTWDIFVMDADGKNVTQITNESTHDLHPTFSPDGNRLAFSRYGGRSGRWELWTVDLVGGERKMIGFGLFPDWSPNGDVIAYQRARQRGTRWFSLWTLELRDGEPLAPTEVAVSTNAAIVAPSWSPDGSEIAFATVIEPTAENVNGQQDIWIINHDGTQRRRLTDGIGTNATPYWASDDRVYFVSDRGGHECVWSAAAEIPAADSYATTPATAAEIDDGASATLPTE